MHTKIVVRASDPSASSRAFPWPVLEAGNGSYVNGAYSVTCTDKEPKVSFLLHHSVQDAPLIQHWIDQGRIIFLCTVAAPRSMYRMLHPSMTPEHLVQWQSSDLGEYPMFTPMLVAREEIAHTVHASRDGLHQIWDGRNLLLPKGGRVAVGSTFKFQSGLNGLLDFNLDGALALGQFWVEDSSEDGFKFKVHLATNLYEHLRYDRQQLAGANIMVHIVSAALSILQRDYSQDDGEEGWRSSRNLTGLADLLETEGLPHWADEEFRPEQVATRLYPHKLPDESRR